MFALVLATAMMGTEDVLPLSQWDYYLMAVAEATRDEKHLVVFVNISNYDAARLLVKSPNNWICVGFKEKDFPNCKKGIVVGKWNGKYHERIDLLANATFEDIEKALGIVKQEEGVPVRRQWIQRSANC